ncbi:PREDICTED: uncharacterized protein LOC107191037 [Dufourea novaeangliae]|uniref:Uncharacterized protein n=1 Tax=Dufourea novaeangliae TaxID=178035 RepID=A0A154PLV8_DUFNO|nr:PREDICTED: uncharacterized protein LOC107191037 [Dufourea novaeangliae]KZC12813.1 hypothetical protein WN55_04330 [Dufourea novaeangliae]
MGSLIILLLLGCIDLDLAVHASLNDNLDEKFKQTKIEIAKLHFQYKPPVQKKLYNVQWNNLWQETVDSGRPFVGDAFNRLFFIKRNRVAVFTIDSPLSNQTSLAEITLTHSDGSIQFIRTTVWKTMLYLLVCYETGSCSLYTVTEDLQLRHRQTIHHNGHPMDASFFVRDNRLYLVVADNFDRLAVPSIIYHWRGTYMDAVAKVMTTAAVSVATFKHKQSTIVVFAQNDKRTPDIGSVVYEFTETSSDQIQYLSTIGPVSVHSYNYAGSSFIFLTNQHGPSNLFWWDGQELLNWKQIPEIEAPSSIHAVSVNDEIFFFVGSKNLLRLYKFENASNCTLLSSTKLPDGETVIDAQARVERSTVIVILITVNLNNVYNVGFWELDIKEIPTEHSIEEPDILSKHLSELVDILLRRKPLVEKAKSSWSSLLPANENLTVSNPLIIPNITLESGTVRNIDVFVSEDVVAPRNLEENLHMLIREIDVTVEASKNLLASGAQNSFTGDIVVEGDAFVGKLEIDNLQVDFLNNNDIRSNDIESNVTDESLVPLRGNDIIIENLEIESLCGIPFPYWSLNNDTSKTEINLNAYEIEFSNDTVLLRSNVSLTRLNTRSLNYIDIDRFLDELFVLEKNQRIRGNVTYSDTLQITNLRTGRLNGESIERYMTEETNQTFDKFVVKSLQVENLHVESINGVPVSEAARISRANAIKGKVKIARAHVTDELIADADLKLPESQPVQVYFNVVVTGDLRIKALDIDDPENVLLNGNEVRLNDILENTWTRSTDQTIRNDVTFENNLTIDRLLAKHLNGYAEEEFLYTTATSIPEAFGNLRFENIEVDDMSPEETSHDAFFDDAPESLTIRERLHLKHLQGNRLFFERFNGLPVADVLNGTERINVTGKMDFTAIRARQINVDALNFRFINDEDGVMFLKAAGTDENNRTKDSLKTREFRVENLIVERINGIEMKKLRSLQNTKRSDLKDLVIDGDLKVIGDLTVESIDGKSPDIYLENMAKGDIVLDSAMTIDDLIVENATLEFINGRDANTLFENVFSKSKEQNVSGRFAFYKMSTGNIVTGFINDRNTSDLIWTDQPLYITGNVTFSDLLVDNVSTRTVNGQEVNELYENLLTVPATRIKDLIVDGNISWSTPSMNWTSLTFLFENAVTKAGRQSIHGDVVFGKGVSMSALEAKSKEVDEIRGILNDAVLNCDDVVEITGRKVFKRNLKINTLIVTGNIEIPTMNDVDIVQFNISVVRKDQDEMVTGPLTFYEEAAMNEVLVNDTVHEIPLHELVRATDMLPPNIFFQHLVVLQNVSLKNLDGINFNEFLRDRVTIDGDHDIASNVQFNGIIEVEENAAVTRINGIDPSDLVLNGTTETQLISGSKTFEEDIVVNGNIHASLTNGVDLSSEYRNGVQNDDDVEIIGDLIFESGIKVPDNVTVSGLVNGVNLHMILDDLTNETHEILREFKRNENEIDDSIRQSSQISETLRNVFFYLEAEKGLKIQVPNIKRMEVVYYEEITKLNMFGEEPGPLCGLLSNCSCPTEYVAELFNHDCRVWRTNDSTIVWNHHGLHSDVGVNVMTNTVSSSSECTLSNSENEFTTISWTKPGTLETGDVVAEVKKTSSPIRGFVKDTGVFMTHDNTAFVVLAIYYDKYRASHRTYSMMYKIDFEKNVLSLHQELSTDGAWDIEIFKTNHRNVYLLLGCFGDSEKSFLYRFDENTSKFVTLRTFGGKTRHVKRLHHETDHFVLLDDYDTNAVNIYNYDPDFDNFFDYQSLFYDSRVDGIECFYADESGKSDSFVVVTTENDQFYIYEYMYAQKFKMRMHHRMDDLQAMVPFYSAGNGYIFTGTSTNSTILRIVEQGPH